MKKVVLLLCVSALFIGLSGQKIATAVPITRLGFIENMDPWGHDYKIFAYDETSNNGKSGSLPDKSWKAIADHLESTEWYLATITSQAEQDLIADFMKDSGAQGELWLGGFQLPPDEPVARDGWNWVTGEKFDYTNWAPDEPNDYPLNNDKLEQHLAIWGSGQRRDGQLVEYQWNDEGSLGNITGFILERGKPVPEPTTLLLLGTGLIGLAGFSRKRFMK